MIALWLAPAPWREQLFPPILNPRIRALAVLPLENLSGDPNQQYFADGMTDELTTSLAKLSSLRVVSRTTMNQYKNNHKSRPVPTALVATLGVSILLWWGLVRSIFELHGH
jgi:TolB-like protein